MNELDDDDCLVLCAACGDSIVEEESWTYQRAPLEIETEYPPTDTVCWECYQRIDYRKRCGVEETIVEIEEPGLEPDEFVSRYLKTVEDQNEVQ